MKNNQILTILLLLVGLMPLNAAKVKTVEDGGTGLSFHVFCHNVQPGVDINYQTGDSRKRLQKYE